MRGSSDPAVSDLRRGRSEETATKEGWGLRGAGGMPLDQGARSARAMAQAPARLRLGTGARAPRAQRSSPGPGATARTTAWEGNPQARPGLAAAGTSPGKMLVVPGIQARGRGADRLGAPPGGSLQHNLRDRGEARVPQPERAGGLEGRACEDPGKAPGLAQPIPPGESAGIAGMPVASCSRL